MGGVGGVSGALNSVFPPFITHTGLGFPRNSVTFLTGEKRQQNTADPLRLMMFMSH